MPVQKTEKIWHNGKWINWDDAQIHVLSHVVSYGSAVFEGIRCYETKQGPAIFRLREHMDRLVNSAKIYRMDLPYSSEAFGNAATELGPLSRPRSTDQRRGHRRQLMDPHRTEHTSGHVQSRSKLYEFAVDSHGG